MYLFLKKHKLEQGSIALLLAMVILFVMVIVGASVSTLVLFQLKTSAGIINSTQAYFSAEAGVEDMLLRITKDMNIPSTTTLAVGEAQSVTYLSNSIGGNKIIVSEGDLHNNFKKIRVVVNTNTAGVSFVYGAQAGDGGIIMESNSVIHGNVFSNGSIKAITGIAKIDYDVIVANAGNKIENLEIGTLGESPSNQARVHTCANSVINGDLYYVSGGSSNCTINGGSTNILPNDIEPIALPIIDSQIESWKKLATNGGIETGDYVVGKKEQKYLGPKKIEGNLIIENNGELIVTGTLYVASDITINNGGTIRLDNDYGPLSGVIVTDGKNMVQNGCFLEGSGQESSYLMLLSTNSSIDPNNPAIYVKNNAQGAIFYASNGMIRLCNNINIREATAWKLYLDNNAEITYESGLANSLFSSGPAGGWEVADWSEIE